MSDLLTKERSQLQVSELAASWRALLEVDHEEQPDILWCLEAKLPALFEHFALVVRDNIDLPFGPAVAEFDPPRVAIRKSHYVALHRRHPKLRFISTHEMGHIVLHAHSLQKFFKDGVQLRKRIARMSIETQADEFAIFFLVPEHIAKRLGDVFGIVHRCGVPYWVAKRACEIYGIRHRTLLPYEVADLQTAEEEPI